MLRNFGVGRAGPGKQNMISFSLDVFFLYFSLQRRKVTKLCVGRCGVLGRVRGGRGCAVSRAVGPCFG